MSQITARDARLVYDNAKQAIALSKVKMVDQCTHWNMQNLHNLI